MSSRNLPKANIRDRVETILILKQEEINGLLEELDILNRQIITFKRTLK